MKGKRKGAIGLALVLGICIFATSAFADMLLGSGYHSLKDAVKQTDMALERTQDNYTASTVYRISVDGAKVKENGEQIRLDRANRQKETIATENGAETAYHYYDAEKAISKYKEDESVYVSYSAVPDSDLNAAEQTFFEREEAQDIEKVVDAFVGSLQDVVQAQQKDGKIFYTGDLKDAQIPAFAGALASFGLKYSFFNEYPAEQMGVPALKTDVAVTGVSGRAIQNEDGILTSVAMTLTATGADKDGKSHDVLLELIFEVSDLGTTRIEPIDISGDNVVIYDEKEEYRNAFGKKYIGTYRADIIEDKREAFVKTGEVVLVLTDISEDGEQLQGMLTTTDQNGAVQTVTAVDAQLDENAYATAFFSYKDENGADKTGMITKDGMANLAIVRDVVRFDGDGMEYRDDYIVLSREF